MAFTSQLIYYNLRWMACARRITWSDWQPWWDPNDSDVASCCVQLPGCLQLPWKRSRSPLLLLNLRWKEHWKDESKAMTSKGRITMKFRYKGFGVLVVVKGSFAHESWLRELTKPRVLHPRGIWHRSRTPPAAGQGRFPASSRARIPHQP